MFKSFFRPNVHLFRRRSRTEQGVVGLGFQFPDDMPGKMILDFPVSWNGLTGTRAGILIPIMPSAVADENATGLLKLPDEINPVHAH